MFRIKIKISDETARDLKKILKLAFAGIKLTALGTAFTSAITALTNSLSAGFAMTAAGATTYAAAKNIPKGYDKTKHLSPLAETVVIRKENACIVQVPGAKKTGMKKAMPPAPKAKSKHHVFVSKDAIVERKAIKAGETEDEG